MFLMWWILPGSLPFPFDFSFAREEPGNKDIAIQSCIDLCLCVLRYIPQFICGDLDSAREEVLDFYKKKVSVVAVCSHFYILVASYWRWCSLISTHAGNGHYQTARPRLNGLCQDCRASVNSQKIRRTESMYWFASKQSVSISDETLNHIYCKCNLLSRPPVTSTFWWRSSWKNSFASNFSSSKKRKKWRGNCLSVCLVFIESLYQ